MHSVMQSVNQSCTSAIKLNVSCQQFVDHKETTCTRGQSSEWPTLLRVADVYDRCWRSRELLALNHSDDQSTLQLEL
jgi:hypothetical protein